MVTFDCPHCGLSLEAPEEYDGATLPCPRCEGLVTLQVVTAKQVVVGAVVGGALAALAALFGVDD